ncbi:MAG TPA: hypothetical protein VFN94_09965, partial [Nitrospiria bacterium]|nr:hypothetical protein [Nitrospiria bacterium]
ARIIEVQRFSGNCEALVTENRVLSWTNVIIAGSAVATLVLALVQNCQTSDLVRQAGHAFSASTLPLIKYDQYQWFAPRNLSCENPASGFNAYFRNVSGVPIFVEKSDLEVFMGDRLVATPKGAEVSLKVPGELILAPGQSIADGFEDPSFPDVYKRLRGPGSTPHLNFRLSVAYRSAVTGQQYCYSAKVVILDDCELPSVHHSQVGDEKLVEGACKEPA